MPSPRTNHDAGLRAAGRFWGRGLLGVLLPEACPICRRPTAPGSAELTCPECAAKLPRVSRYCRRCSAPAGPYVDTTAGCGHCRKDRFAFAGAFVADEYKDLVRTAVLAAKRLGGGPAAGWLADRIWERRGDELRSLGVDHVVAVPQHWTRRLVTPHNTAEVIARRLAGRLKAPFGRAILVKRRRTPTQTRLSATARRNNLRDAFAATRDLSGRRVLLVDDVLTTGTTADRAARALVEAGAETVWLAAAARRIRP